MKGGFAIIGTIGGLVVFAIALCVVSYMRIFPQLYNRTLSKLSLQLTNISIPQQTQLTDALSQVGQQSGNSDHCDYLAALLLKIDLLKPDIAKYYQDNYKGTSQLHFYWTNESHQPGIGAANPTNLTFHSR